MIVMKFGGTSIADAVSILRVVNHIKARAAAKTVIVVSAIAEGTNLLTKIVNQASRGEEKISRLELVAFKNRHLIIAAELIKDQTLLKQLEKIMNLLTAKVSERIGKIVTNLEYDDEDFSEILSYGELFSSVLMKATLDYFGVAPWLVNASEIIYTDDNYLKAAPLFEVMEKETAPLLKRNLNQYKVILTQGFIARNLSGKTTLLGREGSDYSAAIIGSLIDAREVQIWTDVTGVMTADPKAINNVRLVKQLSFSEAAALSYFGAKVIHPATIKPVAEKKIPIRVLNSTDTNPAQVGTIISGEVSIGDNCLISSLTFKKEVPALRLVADRLVIDQLLTQVKQGLIQDWIGYAFDEQTKELWVPIGGDVNNIPAELMRLSMAEVIMVSLVCLVGNFKETTKVLKFLSQITEVLKRRKVPFAVVEPLRLECLVIIVVSSELLSIAQELHDLLMGDP